MIKSHNISVVTSVAFTQEETGWAQVNSHLNTADCSEVHPLGEALQLALFLTLHELHHRGYCPE